MTVYLFGILALVAAACIVRAGIGGHRKAMWQRHRLLNEACDLLAECRMILAPDQFPIVTGHIADGRKIRIELIADTMVTRRLPQLWLSVTIFEKDLQSRPAIGALARPTGSEYYSLVHSFPEWMTPPTMGLSLLMRGDGRATAEQSQAAGAHFQRLFADPQVKEAVITPCAARVIYQASQGGRAAHMFLRQAQFALETVPSATMVQAIALAVGLSAVLTEPDQTPASQAA